MAYARKYITFNGLKTSYLYWGGPKAKKKNRGTVVICHANGFSGQCYRYLGDELSKDYTVYSLDFAGHSYSDAPKELKNWDLFRDQILHVLADQKVENAIGIGHSMGGNCLLRVAAHSPQRLKKIIGLDPVILGLFRILYIRILGNPLANVALKRRRSFKNYPTAFKVMAKHPFWGLWHHDVLRDYVESAFKKQGDEITLSCTPEFEVAGFNGPDPRILKGIFSLEQSVHLIVPENSGVVPVALQKKLTAKSGSSLITLQEAGHLFPFTHPEETIRLVRGILNQ